MTYGRQAAAAYHWLHDTISKPRIDPLHDVGWGTVVGLVNAEQEPVAMVKTYAVPPTLMPWDVSRWIPTFWAQLDNNAALDVTVDVWYSWTAAGVLMMRYLTTIVLATVLGAFAPDNRDPSTILSVAERTDARQSRVMTLEYPIPCEAAAGHGLVFTVSATLPASTILYVYLHGNAWEGI